MRPWARLRGSVRARVTVSAVLVGALGAAGGSLLFVGTLHENLEQSLLSSASQQAETIDLQLRSGASVEEVTTSTKRDLVVQVVRGREVLGGQVGDTDRPVRDRAGTFEDVRVRGLEDSFAVVVRPTTGDRLVLVGLSEEQVTRATDLALALLAVGAPLGLMLLGAVVWLAIGRALRPVEQMRHEAASITADDLTRRLPVPLGADELPRLATTLNTMLAGLDLAQARQRQFVADASHELRSPLATLRQTADNAGRRPESTSVEELARSVLAEEARMESLVSSLLTLARLDDGERLSTVTVDLDDIVLEEVDRLRRLPATRVRLDLHGVSAARVVGQPTLLRQVVHNLLANATRHARTVVAVGLREEGDRTVLTVEDDGAGISQDDRQRVFERFVRLDEARARDDGGSGLGLAIVREVVSEAGGTCEAGESALGGAHFTVAWPTPNA